MVIEKGTFLLLVGTLAAGGAGGFYAAKNNVLGTPARDGAPRTTQAPATTEPAPSMAVATTPSPASTAPAAPSCDDATGTPGDCPPASSYSAEEGGCGALPVKRCNDFKQALKPKVAAQAVACLNALKPYERCDEKRSSLCGHAALMNACIDPDGSTASGTTSVAAGAPAADNSGGPAGQLHTVASGVTAACTAIVSGCTESGTAPSVRDCRATLSGMTDRGRNATVECMKTHCADKGLLGCELALDSSKLPLAP